MTDGVVEVEGCMLFPFRDVAGPHCPAGCGAAVVSAGQPEPLYRTYTVLSTKMCIGFNGRRAWKKSLVVSGGSW